MNSDLLHDRIGGVGLALGSLTFALGDLLRRTAEPESPTATTLTAAAKEHPATWLAAALLVLSASFLIVPGTVAAARWVRGRGEVLTTIGAYLLGGGMIASVLHVAGYYGLYAIFAGSDAGPAAITSIDAQSEFVPAVRTGDRGVRRRDDARHDPALDRAAPGPPGPGVGPGRGSRVRRHRHVSGVPAGIVGLVAALGSLGTVGVAILRSPGSRADDDLAVAALAGSSPGW